MSNRLIATLTAMQQAVQAQGGGVGDRVLDAVIGAAVGGLIAVAAFRTRLEVYASRVEASKEQRAEDRKTDEQQRRDDRAEDRLAREGIARELRGMCESLDRARREDITRMEKQTEKFDGLLRDSERRQRTIIELMAAIAGKLEIKHRLTDALVIAPDDDTPTRG